MTILNSRITFREREIERVEEYLEYMEYMGDRFLGYLRQLDDTDLVNKNTTTTI